MAITPRFVCGGGFGRLDGAAKRCTEFANAYTGQPLIFTSADGHTGAYPMQFKLSTNTGYGQLNVSATRQLRSGVWIYHNEAVTAPTAKSVLLEWRQADGTHIGWLGVSATTNKLGVYVGDHSVACTETASVAFGFSQWYDVGIDLKIDSVNGWLYVYQDGVEIISFNGNTGNADVGQLAFGYCGTGGVRWDSALVDDFYVDDTTAEGAPACPPDRRIYVLYANGAGAYAEGLAKGGGASAYTNVDDGYVSDIDATFNYVDALNERELSALTTFAPPAGGSITAVQAKVHALKTNAAVDTQIAVMTRGGAVATDNEDAAQALAGDWLLYSGDIELLDPAGGAWVAAQIDSLQAGFRGKGTF
jgi:hypothetical protein